MRGQLRASLPLLDGSLALAGLSAPVSVTRDALGIPRSAGDTRGRRARHRLPARAGALLPDGPRPAACRRRAGRAGRPARPRRSIATSGSIASAPRRNARSRLLSPADRALLDAYTDGVNAGLKALGAVPVRVPRASPDAAALARRRTPSSSCCRCSSRCRTPTAPTSRRWRRCTTVPAAGDGRLPRASARPNGMRRSPAPAFARRRPCPDATSTTCATRRRGKPAFDPASATRAHGPFDADPSPRSSRSQVRADRRTGYRRPTLGCRRGRRARQQQLGGLRTADTSDGRAAPRQRHAPDDSGAEHLVSRRARVAGRRQNRRGTPSDSSASRCPACLRVVVGSNTHVAWGFTNTYADWSDIVLLDVDPAQRRTATARRTAGANSSATTR